MHILERGCVTSMCAFLKHLHAYLGNFVENYMMVDK